MDKHYVKTIIEGLKSTSSSRVQESLMKIRNKVIVNDNGINIFTECGGLNYLILHLRKPNERILDLTLSILGNCCLNDECRIEVGKLNTFAPLISVLKTVSRESIVGRACRVVGNLAQNSSNAEEFHNHGAVQALVTLIESRDKNTSYPTLIMAVRALRQLWMVIDKREEMLSVNSVRCIANLLHTECDKAGIVIHDVNPQKSVQLRKSVEGLITGILKSFGCFTTHITSQCADQIQGNNRGFHCLVALMTTYESLALRVLINLCYIPTCRTLLGNAGLIQGLIEVLGKITDVTLWPEGAARALSQLCSESNNRCQISRGGGFPILIAAAKEYTYALEALMQFFFDDTGFQILVEEGLVTLLTDILKKHVETMDSEHEYKTPVMNVSLNDALEKASDPTEMNTPKTDVCLFKRRKHLSAENKAGLSVVIERDNYLVGFNETIDTDSDDSKCEDDIQQIGNTLKRPRPKSPTSFMKRARVWSAGGGSGVYWEPKREREGQSTSRSAFSPEPAPMSPLSDGASGFSPEYRAHKKGRSDWSPESGFSTGDGSAASPYWTEYQWSPSSDDSPKSPFSVNEESSDSEISGRYSPVCSEHDAETEPAAGDIIPTTTVELDAAQLALDELAMDDGHEDNDDEPSGETEQDLSDETYTSRVHCVLMLLHRVASGPDPHSMRHRHGYEKDDRILYSTVKLLAEKDCMNTLLDYIAKCRKPKGRPARILSLVFSKSECVTNILHSKIVLRLYSMSQRPKHPVAKCRQCKMVQKVCVNLMTQLSIITESNYANGEITYLLLRGPKSSKEILALTLSYIVKSKVLLNKFYIGCYALKLLFAGVLEPTEEFEYYVTSLGKLATNIHVKNPKVLENRYCDQISVRYDPILDGLSNDEIVTFELDDLSTVKANRTFLCQSSDVFSAMLTGGFKESVEKSVRLKKVTKPGLEYLLTLLNCGLDNANCELQVFPMADELEANLEALLLADRYLLERLKILLISAILQFKLTPDSADKIYVWSLSEGMGFLCVESVAYLLTGEMDDADRTQAFKNIMNLEYKEQWLDDIKSIIMRHLEKMT